MPITRLAYWGYSTEYADIDFETYSEAGYVVDRVNGTIRLLQKNKKSIAIVGAAAYSEHPSAKLRSLAYDLKDGKGKRLWIPGCTLPYDLFEYIRQGGIICAWNSFFEFCIWKNVCVAKMGWPELPLHQLRDDAAKARAFSVPGRLEYAGVVLQSREKKSAGGRYIELFCLPQKPRKNQPLIELDPMYHPEGVELYKYNLQDISAECSIASMLPDLMPFEEQVFLHNEYTNERGIQMDVATIENAIKIWEQAEEKYTRELQTITGGAVKTANEREKILGWLAGRGVTLPDLTADTVKEWVKKLPKDTSERRVLEIRSILGSAAVKKLYSMKHHTCNDGRVRGLFVHCGADRTGRWASYGVQFHNQKSDGPETHHCGIGCGSYYSPEMKNCPVCGLATFLNDDREVTL